MDAIAGNVAYTKAASPKKGREMGNSTPEHERGFSDKRRRQTYHQTRAERKRR